MTLVAALASLARAHPALPAIGWEREDGTAASMSYGTLGERVARIAGALRTRHRLAPGERVAIVMENRPEFFPLLHGIWRAGLAAVPVNARLHPKEIAWILADAGARLAVASPDLAARMGEHPGEAWPEVLVTESRDYDALLAGAPLAEPMPDPAAAAWLFYTSGTTGRPKGAVLTHRNLLAMVYAYTADIDFIGPADTFLHAAPLTHGSGLYGLAHLACGARHIILPGAFDPARVLDAFARHPNVSMFAAPTMLVRLLAHPGVEGADLSGLKTIVYGGAPMYLADLERALALFGPRLYHLYGQGESPMTITGLAKDLLALFAAEGDTARLASAGTARTGVEVRILGEDGRELPPGAVGEVATRSDCVMQGYWRNEEATGRSLREGWLWTGDLGMLDERGFLTLKDRSKDLIISGGANIYPREIEEILLTSPAVLECAVVSRPHPEWGEEVVAFLVARPGAEIETAALDRLCLDNIARFKRPRAWRVVEALPKNNYGKVLKTELRAALLAEAGRGSAAPPAAAGG